MVGVLLTVAVGVEVGKGVNVGVFDSVTVGEFVRVGVWAKAISVDAAAVASLEEGRSHAIAGRRNAKIIKRIMRFMLASSILAGENTTA